jgi:hypothetical protein
MPFVYSFASKTVAENYNVSGTANTEIDAAFIKAGATRPCNLQALRVQGKGVALTALTGLAFRIKQWTTTSSAGGTALAFSPVDNRAPAVVSTGAAGAAGGVAAVTSGTGGPSIVGGCGCGGSGPGGWVAATPDNNIILDGGAAKSTDLFSASGGTVSLPYEFWGEIVE